MKKFLALLLALLMVFSFAACGANEDEGTDSTESNEMVDAEKAKIGGLFASLGFDFQIKVNNGIQRAAEEFDYEYVSYDYDNDIEKMMSGMDTMVSSGVKAMYAIFAAPDAATEFMNANEEMAVVTQGALTPGAKATTVDDFTLMANNFIKSLEQYVTENNITSGTIYGLWLPACENQDDSFHQAMLDIKAVIEAWCEGKDFAIGGDFFPADNEEAANMSAQMLNADPDARFVFCLNNGYAIACANEISSAVSDTSEYFVFSSEGDDETFRLIDSGTSPMRGCTYMDIEALGYSVGLELINWVENGTIENVIIERSLVDASNIDEYMG